MLQKIADKHQLSVAQVVISWALQSNVVTIPRSSRIDHIAELSIFYHAENTPPHQHHHKLSTEEELLQVGAAGGDQDNNAKLRIYLDDDDIKLIDSLDGTIKW